MLLCFGVAPTEAHLSSIKKKKEIYFFTSFLINKCGGVVIFSIKVTQQRRQRAYVSTNARCWSVFNSSVTFFPLFWDWFFCALCLCHYFARSDPATHQSTLKPFLAHKDCDLDSDNDDQNDHDLEKTVRVFSERDTANIDTQQARQKSQRQEQSRYQRQHIHA